MMMKVLACDFCAKTQHEIATLVAGPNDVCICDECVALCNQIIAEKATKTPAAVPEADALREFDCKRGGE